jgi:[amino group carrier protein]-lysine/ornithine hydrolase
MNIAMQGSLVMEGIDPVDLETLIDLVSIDSPSGEESRAVDYLVERMRNLGYCQSIVDQAGNAVGWLGDGPRQIVMLGHIDTVPGKVPVRVEDDILFGRGSVDAKGPLAAFVEAAARVGVREGWQIVVIGAVDEERDSSGARACVDHYHPDYAIIGEPSRWSRMTLGYKGSAWTQLTLKREVGHNASGKKSACEAAFETWNALRDWVDTFNGERKKVFDQVSPSLRGFASGSDGFEEWARLEIDVRLPVDLPPSTWYTTLQELLPSCLIEPASFPVPAYLAQKNNPLVREFLRAIRSTGGEPGFVLKSGTSDMNVVAPGWNCPILAYGPGDSALDHTDNEHIPLAEYQQAVVVLQKILLSISSNNL